MKTIAMCAVDGLHAHCRLLEVLEAVIEGVAKHHLDHARAVRDADAQGHYDGMMMAATETASGADGRIPALAHRTGRREGGHARTRGAAQDLFPPARLLHLPRTEDTSARRRSEESGAMEVVSATRRSAKGKRKRRRRRCVFSSSML